MLPGAPHRCQWLLDTNPALATRSNFANHNKLKRQAMKVIASAMPADEIAGLAEIFKSIDADSSGTITAEELSTALKNKGSLLKKVSRVSLVCGPAHRVCPSFGRSLHLRGCAQWVVAGGSGGLVGADRPRLVRLHRLRGGVRAHPQPPRLLART